VRFLTSPGSFVLTIALPQVESLPVERPSETLQSSMDEVVPMPLPLFGRRVAERIRSVARHALSISNEIESERDDLTAFETDPGNSGNATELEGLSGLGGKSGRPYQLRFATSLIASEDLVPPEVLQISSAAQDFFARGARLLRERKPKSDVTVRGKVVRLARDGGLGPGEIVVRGVEASGFTEHRYRMHLTDDWYRQALAAHEQSAEVGVRGALAIRGNFLMIEDLRWFASQQALLPAIESDRLSGD
jgi:hypothetical protein